jgi:hypothetical protein
MQAKILSSNYLVCTKYSPATLVTYRTYLKDLGKLQE